MRAGECKTFSQVFWWSVAWALLHWCTIRIRICSFLHRLIDDTVIRVIDIHHVQPIGDTDLSRN